MLLHDAPAEREPQPRPFALGLRREERLEDLRLDLAGNSRAGVGDGERDAAGGGIVPDSQAETARALLAAHGVVGVGDQVDEDLVELMGIGPEHGQTLGNVDDDLDAVGPELVAEELDRPVEHLLQHGAAALGRPLPGQRQEVADDPHAPVGGVADSLGPVLDARILVGPVQQLGLPADDRERVVELVRHPGQQGAHGGDLLALEQLLGALANRLLERAIVLGERHVQPARLEEIADAQQHLELLERLGEKVPRARRQGPSLRLRGRVGRQHDDRQVGVGGDLRLELSEHRHPVEVRHHQVEQDEVRLEVTIERQDATRIGRGGELAVAG